MPKRFTDTNKLKKKWIRDLKAPYKLLWVYLLDFCDNSGIWEVDFEIASIYCGGGISENEALEILKDKIIPFDNGEKWFIFDFIEFQYGSLNQNNPAHKGVIRTLEKHGFLNDDLSLKIKAPSKGLQRGLIVPKQGTKDKDKEKETDKEKEKALQKSEIQLPWQTENFKAIWFAWKAYKKKEFGFKYKSIQSEQAAVMQLNNLASGIEKTAIEIVKQSMANGWKGFFELKNNGTGKRKEMYSQEFLQKYGMA